MAALPLLLLFILPLAKTNTIPYDLNKCEEHPTCPCKMDPVNPDQITPCDSVLNSFSNYRLSARQPFNKTLIITGYGVDKIPQGAFQGAKIRELVVKDVPSLQGFGGYPFWSARLDVIDLRLTTGQLDTIDDKIFESWQPFTPDLNCKLWKGFSNFQKGTCHYLSIVVEPDHRSSALKSVRLARNALSGTYWIKGLRLGGLLNPYDEHFLEPYGRNLTHLELSGNTLLKLQPRSTDTLTKLTSLVISKKYLQNVSRITERQIGFWFKNKPDLTKIGIQDGFEIKDGNWVADIENPELVTEVSLSGNSFPDGLPKLLRKFRNLEKLDLQDTSLINGGNLRDFKNDFYRLQQVILPKVPQRSCDCDEFFWIIGWAPYEKTEASVLHEVESYLLPMILPNGQPGDLNTCLKWCWQSGSVKVMDGDSKVSKANNGGVSKVTWSFAGLLVSILLPSWHC